MSYTRFQVNPLKPLYKWDQLDFDPKAFRFSSVQSLSRVWLFVTPWIVARQASLSITNSWSSLRLTSIESVMLSSHLILCRPLLLPPIPPSIRVFSDDLGTTAALSWSHQGGSQMGPKNLSHRFNAENQLILSIWKKNLAYNFKKF